VKQLAAEFTAKAHAAGKMTAMFQGDHWIGSEPYADDFGELGVDISIGACGDGTSLRRVADSGGDRLKEIRLYPYLFPDTFNHEGGDPAGDARRFWRLTRRAMLRRPIDRIGYGGYLSLAVQFPDFITAVTGICDEFRALKHHSQMGQPYTIPVRVAVLTAWGKLRSWFGASDLGSFGGGIPGSNVQECLSGLPVDVRFIDFDDVRDGALDSVDVVINDGDAGSSWSGGDHWKDPEVVTALRRYVHEGGGFIGARQPSAVDYQGRFFQLADVLGVDEEIGRTLYALKPRGETVEEHFILEDAPEGFDPGHSISRVYPVSAQTQILHRPSGGSHVLLAVNQYGKGRAVYISRLPFAPQNARLLLRAILWSAAREEMLSTWYSSHPGADVAAYPDAGTFAVANTGEEAVATTVCDGNGEALEVSLGPGEIKWFGKRA
jgi:1,3-beta-galactosyl-N-acetylhexosamine phosphorylase